MLRVRHFPPKPLEELHRCSPSVCDHFVRDSARVPLLLPLTVTVQHRLLPRANVSQMYAKCFDKVLYHVNSRILKCKMTNVITRINRIFFYIHHHLGLELAWIFFLHLPSSMHGAFRNATPHGPCIMHLATVSWANLFVSGFKNSTLSMRSTSSTVCGL